MEMHEIRLGIEEDIDPACLRNFLMKLMKL